VEPSRISFFGAAFSHRLQNLGNEIVLHKPDIASQLSRADNGSGKVQSEIPNLQNLHCTTATSMLPEVLKLLLQMMNQSQTGDRIKRFRDISWIGLFP
jgi:hypothetical protein